MARTVIQLDGCTQKGRSCSAKTAWHDNAVSCVPDDVDALPLTCSLLGIHHLTPDCRAVLLLPTVSRGLSDHGWGPDAKFWMFLVYLKYYTLHVRPLLVYPKVLFCPKFSIKGLGGRGGSRPAAAEVSL